jgi:hypothetical protein
MAQEFLNSIPGPEIPFDDRRIQLAISLKYYNNKPTSLITKVEAIVYGLTVLKFDPMLFNTSTAETDWYIEVRRALEETYGEGIKKFLKSALELFERGTDDQININDEFKRDFKLLFNIDLPDKQVRQFLLKFLEEIINRDYNQPKEES